MTLEDVTVAFNKLPSILLYSPTRQVTEAYGTVAEQNGLRIHAICFWQMTEGLTEHLSKCNLLLVNISFTSLTAQQSAPIILHAIVISEINFDSPIFGKHLPYLVLLLANELAHFFYRAEQKAEKRASKKSP